MAATLSDIRTALKTTMTGVSGLRCFDTAPDNPSFPAAIVIPTGAEFDQAMGRGLDEYRFDVIVMAQGQSDRAGQTALDALVSGAGSSSIRAVLWADPTLGQVVSTSRVEGMTAYGESQTPDGARYYRATLTVVVQTRGV